MYTLQVDETRIDASKPLLFKAKNGFKIFVNNFYNFAFSAPLDIC